MLKEIKILEDESKVVNENIIGLIDFEKSNGLIPAIIQDIETNGVLMLGYMNKESFMKTIQEKTTWFYSRSRKKLWNKGETSGNFQFVKEIRVDCDLDSILIKVKQNGVACHTGNFSCFFNKLEI